MQAISGCYSIRLLKIAACRRTLALTAVRIIIFLFLHILMGNRCSLTDVISSSSAVISQSVNDRLQQGGMAVGKDHLRSSSVLLVVASVHIKSSKERATV